MTEFATSVLFMESRLNRNSMSSLTNTTTSTDVDGRSSSSSLSRSSYSGGDQSVKGSPAAVVLEVAGGLFSPRSMSNDLTKMILDTRIQQEKGFGSLTAAAVSAASAVQLAASTSSRHSSGSSSSQGSVVGAGTTLSAASNMFGKTYHCQRCLNHGVEVPRKGHKRHCEYALCVCPNCDLVDQRRKLNKAINSEREKNGSPTGNEKTDGMSKIKTRNPKCARCSVHSNNAEPPPLKGHKNSCPYKACDCKKCALVNSRRSIMAKQIHLRRTQKSRPGQRLSNSSNENRRDPVSAVGIGRSLTNHARHHQNVTERRSAGSKTSSSPDILKPHDLACDLPPFMPHYLLNPMNNALLHHGLPPPPPAHLSPPLPPPHSIYEYLLEQAHQRQRAAAIAAAVSAAEPTSDSPPASTGGGPESPPAGAFLGGNAAAFLAAQRRLLQGPTLPLKGAQMNLGDNGDSNGLPFMTGSRSLGLPLSSPTAANFYEFFFNAILNTGHLLSSPSSSSSSSSNFQPHNHNHHHHHHHAGLSPQHFAAALSVAAAAATASPSILSNNNNNGNIGQIFDFEQQRLNAAAAAAAAAAGNGNADLAAAWRHMFLPPFSSSLPEVMRLWWVEIFP